MMKRSAKFFAWSLRLRQDALRERATNRPQILAKLAETTKDVDLTELLAYSQLLDDLTDLEVSSDYLREIGTRQFPENAAEYVKRLISIRKGGQRSL